MSKCPCGEDYNFDGTCVKCDKEFVGVVDELQAASTKDTQIAELEKWADKAKQTIKDLRHLAVRPHKCCCTESRQENKWLRKKSDELTALVEMAIEHLSGMLTYTQHSKFSEEYQQKKQAAIDFVRSNSEAGPSALAERDKRSEAKGWRGAAMECGVMSDPSSRQHALNFEKKAEELEK